MSLNGSWIFAQKLRFSENSDWPPKKSENKILTCGKFQLILVHFYQSYFRSDFWNDLKWPSFRNDPEFNGIVTYKLQSNCCKRSDFEFVTYFTCNTNSSHGTSDPSLHGKFKLFFCLLVGTVVHNSVGTAWLLMRNK